MNLRFLLIIVFVSSQVFSAQAQIPSFDKATPPTPGSEYFVGKDLGRPLVRVHLINGVQKPGVYHVPSQTNLAEMLSYAGGATQTSDLETVTIRRSEEGRNKNIKVDLDRLLSSTSSIPTVEDNDVVHIKQDLTVAQTQTWLSIASTVATIALTLVLIEDNSN